MGGRGWRGSWQEKAQAGGHKHSSRTALLLLLLLLLILLLITTITISTIITATTTTTTTTTTGHVCPVFSGHQGGVGSPISRKGPPPYLEGHIPPHPVTSHGSATCFRHWLPSKGPPQHLLVWPCSACLANTSKHAFILCFLACGVLPAVPHGTNLLLVTFSFVLLFAPLFRWFWGSPTQFRRVLRYRCWLAAFPAAYSFSCSFHFLDV